MSPYRKTCISAAVIATFCCVAQTSVRVDLNISNCIAHSRSIRALNELDSIIQKTIVLLAADSLVAERILQRFGVDAANNVQIQYCTADERSRTLIDGAYSRVRVYQGSRLFLDINLDNLEDHVTLLNELTASRVTMSGTKINPPPTFSTNTTYEANHSNYWIFDALLTTIWRLPFSEDTSTIVPQTLVLSDSALADIPRKLELMMYNTGVDGQAIEDVFTPETISPSATSGDSLEILLQCKIMRAPGLGRHPFTYRKILARYTDGQCMFARIVQLPDTASNAIIDDLHDSRLFLRSDSILSLALRYGKADSYPLFVWYRSVGGELTQGSTPPFEYPKVLWDNGYQYQFIKGYFTEQAFAFASFPLVVSTDDWLLHDVATDLGVSLDSALARVRFHYYCKDIYESDGLVTMLCYLKGETFLARFLKKGFKFIDKIPVNTEPFNQVSMVLVDHNLLFALDKKRETLWRITLE